MAAWGAENKETFDLLVQMPVLSAENVTNESYKIEKKKKNHLCVSLTSLKVLFSYRLQTAHRQTSPLQQGCPWGSGQARIPSSAPRCRTDGGWQSGRRRPGGQQGWCIPPQSVTVKMLTLRHLKYETSAAEEAGVLTWGERAILIMVMMGGRRRRVSFKQRSNKLRSFSWWWDENQLSLLFSLNSH